MVVVERDRAALAQIGKSADALGVSDQVELRSGDVRRIKNVQYDVILADPPYRDDPHKWLEHLAGLVAPSTGLLVLESRSGGLDRREVAGLTVDWQRRYGDSEVSFWRWSSANIGAAPVSSEAEPVGEDLGVIEGDGQAGDLGAG